MGETLSQLAEQTTGLLRHQSDPMPFPSLDQGSQSISHLPDGVLPAHVLETSICQPPVWASDPVGSVENLETGLADWTQATPIQRMIGIALETYG